MSQATQKHPFPCFPPTYQEIFTADFTAYVAKAEQHLASRLHLLGLKLSDNTYLCALDAAQKERVHRMLFSAMQLAYLAKANFAAFLETSRGGVCAIVQAKCFDLTPLLSSYLTDLQVLFTSSHISCDNKNGNILLHFETKIYLPLPVPSEK